MNLFQKIKTNLENKILHSADDGRILIEAAMRRGVGGQSSLSSQILVDAKNIQAQNLKQWKNAVSSATDPDSPDWTSLSELYYNLLLDNHLRSVIDSRILYVQRSPFKLVDDAGQENKDITWLLERPWFEDLVRLTIMSRFQGRTLIELFNTTPAGELAEVTEIPQTHFNARLGIISKDAGDTSGWFYKEGIFANYYAQIGRDYDLGMLEKLAIIVLAKKLGMGSWLDYVEKYGVPPLFITTDREDDGRLRQLFEAASQFKSNHFMVGRGQEKFTVGDIKGAGVAPFDLLINRANDEISKAVLGGSGLTDEKAFVGSSEIQYKLAKDRYESDKLLFKHAFNHIFKPKLLSLSPVYAPLEKYYFEWDNTETLDMNGIIDTIEKIGNIFEIDPKYVTQVTGIPILGLKKTPNPITPQQPSGGRGGKKQ